MGVGRRSLTQQAATIGPSDGRNLAASSVKGQVHTDRGGGTKKKVGGLTLPLNDCTEAGVQGLHSEEFLFPLASEKVVGLSPPTPQSGWAEAPSAPPGSATPAHRNRLIDPGPPRYV